MKKEEKKMKEKEKEERKKNTQWCFVIYFLS